jgi:hypothetical protein
MTRRGEGHIMNLILSFVVTAEDLNIIQENGGIGELENNAVFFMAFVPHPPLYSPLLLIVFFRIFAVSLSFTCQSGKSYNPVKRSWLREKRGMVGSK